MVNRFFEQPILNPPYEYPAKHWEFDDQGQPTQQVIENRRGAEFITPIPKPRKRKAAKSQQQFVFDEGKGLSTQEQQYDVTAMVNEIRRHVDQWRKLRNPNDWRVTPETARLLALRVRPSRACAARRVEDGCGHNTAGNAAQGAGIRHGSLAMVLPGLGLRPRATSQARDRHRHS